ncbi:MAG: queuosine precursor transporter [Planctomycetota bacterium]
MPLPTEQHAWDGLPELDARTLQERRERVFLILAGLFLATLAMLNILGVTRFIAIASITDGVWSWGTFGELSFAVAVGVLPYPLTFLCTDFICECYGRARANRVVWMGLVVNLWVVFILWVGGVLPPVPDPVSLGVGVDGAEFLSRPIPEVTTDEAGAVTGVNDNGYPFFRVRELAFGAVTASMLAYFAAQFVDVQVFHFWKMLTKGKHLWLRNNGSTFLSQLVDTSAVILITHFYANALPIDPGGSLARQLALFIATGYAFKVLVALIDTGPFYFGSYHLRRYLRLPPATKSIA